MTESQKSDERWERIKAAGKKRFILVNGVLGWGIGLAFATAIGRSFMAGGAFMDHFPRELAIALPIWMVGGAVWATLTWRGMERAEERAEEKEAEE